MNLNNMRPFNKEEFLKLNPNISPDLKFNKRASYIMEIICEHGVGHPIWIPYDNKVYGYHGCCQECCCTKYTIPKGWIGFKMEK